MKVVNSPVLTYNSSVSHVNLLKQGLTTYRVDLYINVIYCSQIQVQGSLTVWALYAYFSDSQNAAFELLVWCM